MLHVFFMNLAGFAKIIVNIITKFEWLLNKFGSYVL